MNVKSGCILKMKINSDLMRNALIKTLNEVGDPFRVLHNRFKLQQWIYFGHPGNHGAEVRQWTINGNGYINNDAAGTTWGESRLQSCGLLLSSGLISSNHGTYLRRYVVRVFHLQMLQIFPLSKNGTMTSSTQQGQVVPLSKLWKRIERVAVRALYALNLEMGEVTLSAREEGVITVDSISDTWDLWGNEAVEILATAMTSALSARTQLNSDTPLLIGMDPEFLLFDRSNKKVIPASRYFNKQGEAGCDSLRIRDRLLFPLVELRPKPGHEPREVIQHLLHAFQVARDTIGDDALQWQAGGMPQKGFPLGGHIHFSGVTLSMELLQCLDNYLALLVFVLEDERSFRRRPSYGFLGDFRLQDYGGFEYRTLPSFLISPLVAKGVVALSRLIVDNVEDLKQRPLHDDKIYHAFYHGRQDRIRPILPSLINDITSLPSYKSYEGYIAPFLEAVTSGATWDESRDIKKYWKMQNPS